MNEYWKQSTPRKVAFASLLLGLCWLMAVGAKELTNALLVAYPAHPELIKRSVVVAYVILLGIVVVVPLADLCGIKVRR